MKVPDESMRVITQELINIRESLYRLRCAGADLSAMTEDHRLAMVEVLYGDAGVVGDVQWVVEQEQWVISMYTKAGT